MKKALVAVVAGLLLLGAGSAIADEEANFKKAGQQVLAEKERLLAEKRDAVLATVAQVVVDQVVTGSEMSELHKGIDDFGQAKSNADDYLKFYELTTTVVLPDELVLAVDKYWNATGFFARDRNAGVRTYLVRLTGRDVVVQDSGPVIGLWQIFMLLMVIAVTFFLFIFIMLAKRQLQSGEAILAVLLFIIVLLLWYWLFFL